MINQLKKVLKLAAFAVVALGALKSSASAQAIGPQNAIFAEDYNARRVSTNAVWGNSEGSFLTNQSSMAALTLYYKGSSTESVVTINFSSITFFAPAGTADTTIGASGVIAWGAVPGGTVTYASMGGLCDAINNLYGANYGCVLNDARRSDPSAWLQDQTNIGSLPSANLKQPGGYDVGFDTGGANGGGNSTNSNMISLGITPSPGQRVILKSCQFLASGSGGTPGLLPTFSISGVKINLENATNALGISYPSPLDDSVIVWTELATSSQAIVTTNFDDTGLGGITFAQANQGIPQTLNATAASNISHVVVRVAGDTLNMSQNAVGNFLKCYWVER